MLGERCRSSWGASKAFVAAGGVIARTVHDRSPFDLVTRGARVSVSALGLMTDSTLPPPSTTGGDLDPSEVLPGGTPGDEDDDEQEG